MDLIKNKMLAELEKKKIEKIDDAFDKWVRLIDNLPDYSTQERFLRQFYNAFRYKDKIKVEGISKATKSTLIKIYENLIDNDTKFIFDELINKSAIYNPFIDPKNQYKGLQSLLQIGAAPSYTLLLYLFAEHNRNEKLIQDVINFLIKYFVRRNLTDYPATRDLDKMFMDLIDKCEDAKSSLSSETIVSFLTKPDNFSDVKTFKEKLSGDIYEDNSDVARFILCKIEEGHQTKEIYTDLWDRDKNGKYFWTVEHIFPEGKNIPTEWVQMIANADSQKAKELQEEWVHKLGNLTLTAYNPNLSNFSFEKKRDRQDGKGKNIGYKNGLYLNIDLANKGSWHIEDIENRTNNVAQIALKMFCIDNENII